MERRLRRNPPQQTKSCDLMLLSKKLASDDEGDPEIEDCPEGNLSECTKTYTTNKYDTARVIKIKKSSSKCVTFSNKPCWDTNELPMLQQNLELMVSNYQVDEAFKMEQHKQIQARFERVENVLEALMNYVDCTKLELKSSYRLCHLLNAFLVNEPEFVMTESMSHTIKRLCESQKFDERNSVKSKIFTALDSTKEMEPLYEEFYDRKHDFNTGVVNFKLLLEGMNLGTKELDQLRKQFEDVLLKYQHSRCMLDQEIPRATCSRLHTLSLCLNELVIDLSRICSVRSDTSNLFKSVALMLKTQDDAANRSCISLPVETNGCPSVALDGVHQFSK